MATLALTRPLTAQVLMEGAWFAFGFPFGYATVGLVLTLRRPANPIGWLYAAAALTWSLVILLGPGSTSSSAIGGRCRWPPS